LAEGKGFVELRTRPEPKNARRRPTPESARLKGCRCAALDLLESTVSRGAGGRGESYDDVILRLAKGWA
jgi:hypothetical protein